MTDLTTRPATRSAVSQSTLNVRTLLVVRTTPSPRGRLDPSTAMSSRRLGGLGRGQYQTQIMSDGSNSEAVDAGSVPSELHSGPR